MHISPRSILQSLQHPALGNSRGLFPQRTWRILILVTFLAIVLEGAYAAFSFYRVERTGTVGVGDGEVLVESIDRAELMKAVEDFHTREALFANILEERSPLVDPAR